MILTTSNRIEGYAIVDYVDVIFDEMLVGLGFGKGILSGIDNFFSALTGTEAVEMVEKLNQVKSQLRERIKKKAEDMGANALIGIDFESSRLGDLLMVSMTATAVKIEKLVDYVPNTLEQKERDEQKRKEDEIVEERNRKKEELIQKIDQFKQSGKFDPIELLSNVETLENTNQIRELLTSLQESIPDIITEELIKKIDDNIYVERMWGANGKESCIKTLKEHFDIKE